VSGRVLVPIGQQETSLGAGEGAVWAITNGKGCETCVLVRIDPDKMTVTGRFSVPPGASAVRAGLGGVWITYFGDVNVLRVDPTSGAVEATIPVGPAPAFLDIGSDSVWVMASDDGALCRINPSTNTLTSCTEVEPGGGYGDLTVGDGYVWWGGVAVVVQVDQRDGHVVRRIGLSRGDVSVSAGSGHVWISAHEEAELYHAPVR
jgi:DNA-binding beta-propeller fold protein YncE